jgi:hypothetical protein
MRSASVSSPTASLHSQEEQVNLMLASVEMLLRSNWDPDKSSGSMIEEALLKRPGYSKIINVAREAQDLNLMWIWTNTCCINIDPVTMSYQRVGQAKG